MRFRRLSSRQSSQPASSDAQLLDAYVATGNMEPLGELYSRYTPLVYGVCLKYLQDEEASKDAVMHIFEQLVDKLQNAEVRQFKGWLYTVVKNHCLMQLRQPQRNGYRLESLVDQPDEAVPEDRWPLIEQGLRTLPDEQQRCIRLFYLEQKSYQEVAILTGYELKKVKSYLQNGKRNLKIFVSQHE